MCLPCIDALGFTGLSIYRGTFERLHKIPKPNKQYQLPARVCPHWLYVLRSRPCSPEGGVKAPAVKPCIVYITLLPCSVGSKGLSAYRFVLLYFTPLLADLVKYSSWEKWEGDRTIFSKSKISGTLPLRQKQNLRNAAIVVNTWFWTQMTIRLAWLEVQVCATIVAMP